MKLSHDIQELEELRTSQKENRSESLGPLGSLCPSLLNFKRESTTKEFSNKFSRFILDRGMIVFWPKENVYIISNAQLAKEIVDSEDFSAGNRSSFILKMPEMDHLWVKISHSIHQLVEKTFVGQHKVECVSRLATLIPSMVLAELFGISEFEMKQETIHHREYFRRLIGERRDNPGHDYLSYLIEFSDEAKISEDELLSQIMMMVAGQVTATDQISNSLYLLASHSDIQFTLRQNILLLQPALEEFYRFDPATTFISCTVKNDRAIGGAQLKAGETILISIHAINRTLKGLEMPYNLDIRRKASPHFTLASGDVIIQKEMEILFRELLTQTNFFVIDECKGAERDHYSLFSSGFKSLHLENIL